MRAPGRDVQQRARTYQGMEVVRAMTISGMGAWEVA